MCASPFSHPLLVLYMVLYMKWACAVDTLSKLKIGSLDMMPLVDAVSIGVLAHTLG